MPPGAGDYDRCMLSPRALRNRLLAALAPERDFREAAPPPAGPRLDTEDPVEHLRRAVAASRAGQTTAPSPAIYSELRLLLNQLEAGRISEEPTASLQRRDPEPEPAPEPEPLGRRVLRGLRPAVRRVRSFLRP